MLTMMMMMMKGLMVKGGESTREIEGEKIGILAMSK
jgi:hypothetical protein